ncbi:MptB, dihydroneopterin 2, 3 -cyclic phosphate phosphodiesterase [Acidisarcina polymorpha]|uniref:MptB, dihydroneopterin 2, 3-cyclic phosphate phosphodiesterase n=1 Tax=Acidisarcina polymorpha TaxID=2211140 RepID=A0A2Z5FXH7_9BACT|nr:HD domain-containing protein [Acidisarcina polymorpha]AXC11492.1 MptB, dihydroneopterin 2, 3 -cyclic phosphate phosphodiesterase [Acidisarcina polymorpha]
MKDIFIADLSKFENQSVIAFFTASMKSLRDKKDGGKYLALILKDRTGEMEARMWDNAAEASPEFEQGDVVKLKALVCRYQERLQLKVERIRAAVDGEYDPVDFLPATTKDVDELWAELNGYIASFRDPHLQALLRAFLDDPEIAAAFRQAPAAKAMHHAWLGGLLEHVVSLMGVCELAARHYPEIHRDLLLTGAMLHDIGKLQELVWKKSFDYTVQGQLLGHITIGYGMIEKKLATLPDFPPRLRTLVEHMVLSHHGRYEYGSPKLPMIPEAILLHYLDDMDAKMQTVRSEFDRSANSGRDGAQMTEWVRAMERPLLDTSGYLAGEGDE